MQNLALDKQLKIFIREAYKYRMRVAAVFVLVSVGFLLAGVYWPKLYEANASVLWSNRDSLSPLLRDGVAQTTTLSEQAAIAREVILSNKSLETLIEKGQIGRANGEEELDDRKIEILKSDLRKDVRVTFQGRNLILISYRHTDPEISYLVVSILSQLLIQETREVKNESSRSAFEFIDRQVSDYRFKLDQINNQIIEFRKTNVDLDSDTRTGVNNRVNELKSTIKDTKLLLTESRVRKQSLEDQREIERQKIQQMLVTRSEISSNAERESAYQERLNNLESMLDTLRLSYTDDYPDVIQLKEQIRTLKDLIANDSSSKGQEETSAAAPSAKLAFSESPLYSSLSNEISMVETEIQTLEARLSDAEGRLGIELDRAGKVNALESQLEEMSRDLDVTQSIYDDLLTRRENARVSLNLQLENQGSTFKIQEPAVVPLVPSGLRFQHFALLCIPLGLAVPFGLIYVYLFLDTRIRHEEAFSEELKKYPVLATVGFYSNDADISRDKAKTTVTAGIFGVGILALCVIMVLKVNQVIGS